MYIVELYTCVYALRMIDPSRLKTCREAAGLSQAELARKVGVASPSINRLETGETKESRKINEIAYLLGTTEAYLTGRTDDPTAGALPRPTPELIAEQLDLVQIPILDLRFGMGGGGFADNAGPLRTMPLAREFIRMFTSSPFDKLKLAMGVGDSMYPTIHDQDGLLIDTSQREPRMVDQVWAMYHYGMGMIKRLRPTAEGMRIISDNPNVPDETAAEGALHIEGRVVAVVRRI